MEKIPIQVRLTKETITEIDKSVKNGKFMNRSDFIRDSLRKPDEKKEETVKEFRSNPNKHKNLDARLLKIEKNIHHLKIHHWINFIFLMITILIISIFGAVLL